MTADPNSPPIFVVGFQRSGTTLLQALLGAHPRIAAPPEIYYVARVAEHADYFGDLCEDDNLEKALHEALNPPLDMLADCGFQFDRLLARAKQRPRGYGELLDVMLTDFAERRGKPRWVEKSAGQPLGPLMRLFPDLRAIHIVRDPRDVVASSLKAPWTKHASAAAMAHDWRRFTLATIARGAKLGASQYLLVRYEDLSRDPAAVMRLVCAFVGEEYDSEMVNDASRRHGTVPAVAAPWQGRALERIQPAREGGWVAQLSRLDQLRVNAVVDSMLMPLGYGRGDTRTRLLSMALKPQALAMRARLRKGAKPQSRSPEQRYLLKRRFLEAQAHRVKEAG